MSEQKKEVITLADTIHREINKMCETNDIEMLIAMTIRAKSDIQKLYAMRCKVDFGYEE